MGDARTTPVSPRVARRPGQWTSSANLFHAHSAGHNRLSAECDVLIVRDLAPKCDAESVTNAGPVHHVPATRRIADVDRDRTVAHLSTALAEGRIDQTEFADRADAALAARFQRDLDPLVADLHADEPALESASGRSVPLRISVFALVSAASSFGTGLVVGDMLTGVLIWLVSLVCVGVGVLIRRDRNA